MSLICANAKTRIKDLKLCFLLGNALIITGMEEIKHKDRHDRCLLSHRASFLSLDFPSKPSLWTLTRHIHHTCFRSAVRQWKLPSKDVATARKVLSIIYAVLSFIQVQWWTPRCSYVPMLQSYRNGWNILKTEATSLCCSPWVHPTVLCLI